MKIYRVRTFSKLEEEIESELPLPGKSNSNTGFWTTKLECALKIWHDRNRDWLLLTNGGTRARIVETDIENVIIDHDFEKYKNGHNDEYDKGEIFVKEVIDESKVKVVEIESV